MVSVGAIKNKACVCAHPRARTRLNCGLQRMILCVPEKDTELKVKPGYTEMDRNDFGSLMEEVKLKKQIRNSSELAVLCGKCLECKLSDAKSMAFRCVKEAQQWENNIMITLTYDDEHVPRSKGVDPKTGEIYESLTLPDHEEEIGKFMKRLRKRWETEFDSMAVESMDRMMNTLTVMEMLEKELNVHTITLSCLIVNLTI